MPLQCGVAQRELVFQDGLGLAGYGPFAGQGYHVAATEEQHQLHARVMYLGSGDTRAFVAVVDLWAASLYVQQRVVDRLRATLPGLGDHQFLMIGSHTHSAPGHFSKNRLYDAFAQSPGGFEESVADVVIEALVAASVAAYDARRGARVAVVTTLLQGVGSNRSFGAFLRNFPAGSNWQDAWVARVGAPLIGSGEKGLAVDPRFQVLWAFEADADTPIGTFATIACHNAALGREVGGYHPDLAGYACAGVNAAASSPWAALAQGAAGDVTAIPAGGDMDSLGHPLAASRGAAVARAWAATRERALSVATSEASLDVGMIKWLPSHDGSPRWRFGQAVVNGSEESRSPWFTPIRGEGRKTPRLFGLLRAQLGLPDEQAPKVSALGPLHATVAHYLNDLDPAPEHPLHVLRIGHHAFFTLPGEVTGYAAHVLEQAVLRRAAHVGLPLRSASPIAITNDYCGYFTTEAEYEAQHYEGAHNLFGRRSLERLEVLLTRVIGPEGAFTVDRSDRRPHEALTGDEFSQLIMALLIKVSLPARYLAAVEAKVVEFAQGLFANAKRRG